jgi:hypothetical protein
MRYEKPEFVEIKMDAEIGSYQNDFDPVPFVEREAGLDRLGDDAE